MPRPVAPVLGLLILMACEGPAVSLGEYVIPDAGISDTDAAVITDAATIDSGPIGPALSLTPEVLSFGARLTDCTHKAKISVTNESASFQTVTNFDLEGPSNFSLVSTDLPISIIPGDSVEIEVLFTPTTASATISATLRIEYNEGQENFVLVGTITGRGAKTRTQVDELSQKSAPEIDFLLVLDRSCSMSDELSDLRSQLNKLDTYIRSNSVAFQIGIIDMNISESGSQGRLLGEPKILSSETPNYTNAFRNNIPSTSSNFTEAGIEASLLALTEPLASSDNVGLLRETSALSVLYVTDENDQSPKTVNNYILEFAALRPLGMLDLRALVGTSMANVSPCGSAYAERYIELVQAFDGVISDICGRDWDTVLTDFPKNFGLNTLFELSYPAEESTLKVTVDGTLTSSVSLNNERRRIIFERATIPDRNANIRIEYQTQSCQE